jgi:hypothetical protein
MHRYPVNSPLLWQDPVLPLFFVNKVPHPYCREYEGQDCSSYASNNNLYYVSAGPYHGFFRYYSSAWAASTTVQGTSATAPLASLQELISKWFVFDSPENVIAPPYIEPELGVDGDFSNCFWEAWYSPITTVKRARSILRLDVWSNDHTGGFPILWDDPELMRLHTVDLPMAPQAQVPSYQMPHHHAAPPQPRHTHIMGGGDAPYYQVRMGGGPTCACFLSLLQGYQHLHHPLAMSPAPSFTPSEVPSYVHVSAPSQSPKETPAPARPSTRSYKMK